MAKRRLFAAVNNLAPRILIIVDELLIALLVEEMIRDIGFRVSGIARTTADGRVAIARRNFDAVLLDLNLDGQYHPETADILLELGIPFAFVTGCDYLLEPRHEKIPVLQKPFTPAQLHALLLTLVGPAVSARTAQTA